MVCQCPFTDSKVHTITHLISVVGSLIKRMAVSTNMLLATSNLVGFASLMVITVFMALAKALGEGSVAQLMALYL